MSLTVALPVWTLGELMEKARRDARITTAQMADHFGVNRKTINNWEAGRTHPSRADVIVWAERCEQPWFTLDGIRDLVAGGLRWINTTAGQLDFLDELFPTDPAALESVAA